MRRKFIVAVSDMTAAQEREFIAYLREHKLGWWHHVPNCWLIADPKLKLSKEEIRDKLNDLSPATSTAVILQVDEPTMWSGFHPRGKKSPFSWFRDVWKKAPPGEVGGAESSVEGNPEN